MSLGNELRSVLESNDPVLGGHLQKDWVQHSILLFLDLYRLYKLCTISVYSDVLDILYHSPGFE